MTDHEKAQSALFNMVRNHLNLMRGSVCTLEENFPEDIGRLEEAMRLLEDVEKLIGSVHGKMLNRAMARPILGKEHS